MDCTTAVGVGDVGGDATSVSASDAIQDTPANAAVLSGGHDAFGDCHAGAEGSMESASHGFSSVPEGVGTASWGSAAVSMAVASAAAARSSAMALGAIVKACALALSMAARSAALVAKAALSAGWWMLATLALVLTVLSSSVQLIGSSVSSILQQKPESGAARDDSRMQEGSRVHGNEDKMHTSSTLKVSTDTQGRA